MLPRAVIKTPCSASWDEMKGDDVSRFCFACSKTVYDLDAMGEDAAESFLERHLDAVGVLPCVRLYQRPDGRVLTSECAPAARRRHARRAAIAVGALVAAVAGLAGTAHATEPTLGPDSDDADAEESRTVSVAPFPAERHVGLAVAAIGEVDLLADDGEHAPVRRAR
jgi:hypothetical protein